MNSATANMLSHVCASLHTAREGEFLQKGEGSWKGCSKQRDPDISLAESLPRKKSIFLGSAIITGRESTPFCFPNSISLSFPFINFFTLFHRIDVRIKSINHLSHLEQCLVHHEFSKTVNYCLLFLCSDS